MTAQFRRASIVPFNEAGTEPQDDQAVPLDFNPATLTLKTSAGESRDRSRQGRQQVQNVGASSATLSFEAVFDSTRPRDGEDGRAPIQEEELDVRLRTRPLALLIQAAESEQGSGGNSQPAPRRVQFRWGSIVFNGLITQYQETFDYFSPGGVPLRSKVQITLTEQEFRYEIDSQERARAQAAAAPSPNSMRDAASASGADSLFDLGSGGFSLGLSAGFSAGFSAEFSAGFSADISLQAELGLSVDVGLSAGAGVSLSADAAVDLFGSSALGTGGATAGKSGVVAATPSGSGRAGAGTAAAVKGSIPSPPSPWAPEGPAPGSQAAGLAAIVLSQRAAGIALAAPNTPDAVTPLAPRGSPPPVLPRAPTGIAPLAIRGVPRAAETTGDRRPRWEALGVAPPRFVAAGASRTSGCGCGGGCGCARCGGG
ncbi:hypothetical protein DFH01_12340 [Falsiroseomonas bella]|uniref:Contractile injection system tube protein N-terminal domain-containing protein n=1 Tax=Falsiroseomonas bella TaxID=2184016 RepID=A0A317FGX0_9PROT|nr:hypothetical protein [Falsiroseomonas bella]PWS37602.1 hypothetical protein DFH01_12340 [Falsiroseomonas bella]